MLPATHLPIDRRGVVKWLMLVTLVLGAQGLAADEPLQLRLSPRLAHAPGNVWVHVHIEPCADSRSLEIVADSGEFYRSSRVPLDGERSARTFQFQLRNLPAGVYDVLGIVRDASGHQRQSVRDELVIIGNGGER